MVNVCKVEFGLIKWPACGQLHNYIHSQWLSRLMSLFMHFAYLDVMMLLWLATSLMAGAHDAQSKSHRLAWTAGIAYNSLPNTLSRDDGT